MNNKRVEEMLNLLSTEVKVNEIQKDFLEFVPKRPTSPEKIRPARIIFPISICSVLAVLLISLMLYTINKPIFNTEQALPITETKKIMTYQVIGCLTLMDEISEFNKLSNDQIEKEVDNYLDLADYYLHKNELTIESYVSDDIDYNNKYLISLNDQIYYYFNETTDVEHTDIDFVSSSLEGYILFNNVKYRVTGSKEVVGRYIKTKLRTYYNETDFIEVEQEIRLSINEYDFTFYKDENIVKKVSLAVEETPLSSELAISEDDKSFDFSLKEDTIIADVCIPDVYNGEIIIYSENGEYVYFIEE